MIRIIIKMEKKMLPVLSTSLDQVQARYGECVSTASLNAHTVTLHNNHMIRDSFTTSRSSRFHWSKQLTRLTRSNARLRLPMKTTQADLHTSLGKPRMLTVRNSICETWLMAHYGHGQCITSTS